MLNDGMDPSKSCAVSQHPEKFLSDPLRSSFCFTITCVRATQGHLHLAMTKKASDDGKRRSLNDRMAAKCLEEIARDAKHRNGDYPLDSAKTINLA